MTTEVTTMEDGDELLRREIEAQKEKTSRIDSVVRLQQPGDYRIRILPNNPNNTTKAAWWRTFAMHFWREGLVGNDKTIVFNSAMHTFGKDKTEDPIKVAIARAEQSGDPVLAQLVKEVDSGPSFIVNAMILQPGQIVGDVVSLQINKTTWENIEAVGRMVSPRFTYLDSNICLHVRIQPFKTNKGMFGSIEGREEAVDLTKHGITLDSLPELDLVVLEKTGNAKSPGLFSGDLLNPIAPATAAPAVASAAAVAADAAPALGGPMPAAMTVIAGPATVPEAVSAVPVADANPVSESVPVTVEPAPATTAPVAQPVQTTVAPDAQPVDPAVGDIDAELEKMMGTGSPLDSVA